MEEKMLFMVDAHLSKSRADRVHHSTRVYATSKADAVLEAIELDKLDGIYREEYGYFAYLMPKFK